MNFYNSDLFLRVSVLSLGTFCININDLTKSFWREEKLTQYLFFPFVTVCQNILKKIVVGLGLMI